MDSNRANVSFCGEQEGLAIRDWHVLAASTGRTSRASGNDNGASQMTIKVYLIGAILAVVASAAAPPLAAPEPCAPVIECTQKELTE